jgi:preprotein translocase subunit SecF
MIEKLFNYYYVNYKKILIIPIIILLFNLSVLAYNYFTTGSIVNIDSSLKGGVSLTFNYDKEINYDQLKNHLIINLGTDDVDIVLLKNQVSNNVIGYEILTEQGISKEKLIGLIEEFLNDKLVEEDISFGSQSSVIGDNFIKESGWLFILGFILMNIVSYLYFKDFIPSLSITISTLSDIIGILAVFNLAGIKVGVVTIGALLMIMGYSTDSDILLATNIIKKKDGNLKDRMYSALKTELTMNSTALITFFIMFLLSSVDAIKQISLVLIVGMFFDLLNTWLQNASIQRIYMDYKEKKKR